MKNLPLAAIIGAITITAHCDILDDLEFDENGVAEILLNPVIEPDIHPDMLDIDPTDSGIPNAVKKLMGWPLDIDTDTLLGGISLRERYRLGLNLKRESTLGDGISDIDKMYPPGWTDAERDAPVFFTLTEGIAEATPLKEGDFVYPVPAEDETTWDNISIPLGDFFFPLGKLYHPGPVHVSKYGTLEFGNAQRNDFSQTLPSAELSANAIAVAWDYWELQPDPDAKIVAGFRGEQRGQRYFFTRWEKMDYAMWSNKPLATFEGRLYEDGHVEVHYLEGDFSPKKTFSGVQCHESSTGFTIPQEKKVTGKKIILTPHYKLEPLIRCQADDNIPDAWKVQFNINPHDTNAASMVFNTQGLTLRECFDQRKNPWTCESTLRPKQP